MTNKELKEKIARLETELAEAKKMAVAMKKRADGCVFKPKFEQTYWFISGVREIDLEKWCNLPMQNIHYSIGNCFPSRQSAEDTVRVLKLIRKARESQDGFIVDWENWMQNKYVLYFNTEEKELRITNHISINAAPIFGYWEDESACERFIDENSDELIWYFTEYRR